MNTRRGPWPVLLPAVLPIAILLLALGLRLYRIDAQSLWNDEGTSVAVAGRDLATIARDAANDIHPPLYYWLLAAWQRLTGSSEFAVRSLSALLGVALVALIYRLGGLLQPAGARRPAVAPAAAALAAIHPFLVVYAQEARMYTLLALWAALAFYAALRWLAARPGERSPAWGLLYLFAATAGLYTHYAFPLVLAALNLVVLLALGLPLRRVGEARRLRRLGTWLALQAAALPLYVPWLPVAFRQLGTWPGVDQPVALLPALTRIAELLTTGPAAAPWPVVSWLLLLLLLAYFPRRGGRLETAVAGVTPLAWLAVPVVLILALGLYKEAYLKFLIVACPAYCLLGGRRLGGAAPARRPAEMVLAGSVGLLALATSLHGLVDYYTDPAYARDDYRAMAAYLEAVGRPGDAVVLNAPGQQEVFAYYYDGDLPVYPLPAERPADPAATQAALEGLARPGGRVFALLWATGESDPGRLVEGWLDEHAYKALDSWYGNVRLVAYAVPLAGDEAPAREVNVRLEDSETGQSVTLLGYSQLNDRVAAGDIAQIALFWQAGEALERRYKVFVHLLDEANHVVGQRDSEPGGGALLTTLWQPGQAVRDNYGLPVHPATPPGSYRVEVGLYDAETGRRLLTPEGEGQVWLEPLVVERPPAPAPAAALGMGQAAAADFGSLRLLGYDAHRLGFAHEPDAPLRPGDVLHVNLYWQALAAPGGDWQVALRLLDPGGQEVAAVTAPLAGAYPTSRWQAGDVWRGQFDLPLPAGARPGRYRLQVRPLPPDGSEQEPFVIGLAVEE
jgi:4-amino-4-deoxy-L-arabinose transferase-like glycosyltransferase